MIKLSKNKSRTRSHCGLIFTGLLGMIAANNYLQASPPDSGSLLQQQRQPVNELALQNTGEYELLAPTGARNSPPFYVSRIALTGNHVINREALQHILEPYQERQLDLNDLQIVCYQISSYYRQQGYLFSRAVIPQQSVKDGVVLLQVIEAKLNEVAIINNSNVRNKFLQRIINPAQRQQSINEGNLNQVLLLMRDLPGVEVKTAIQAGNALGQSDLVVEVNERRPKHRLSVNNHGSRSTHKLRANGQFNIANLAGHGDLLGLRLSSGGERMVQAGLNYQLGLGANDSQLGFNLNYLDYALGENLKDLNAEGQAKSAGVYWKKHWQRGLNANIHTHFNLQRQVLDDQINNGVFLTKRKVDSLSLSINSDWRDGFADNSVSQAQLGINWGRVNFSNVEAEQRDARSANSQGNFGYLTLDLQHHQALNADWQYKLRLNGQQSFDNLDSSQKFSTAGPYAVRAYEVGTVSGDSSVLLSAELHYRWPTTTLGDISLYGFVDTAKTQTNHELWQGATGRNRIGLSGVGFGLQWQGFEHWSANTFVATPVGSSPAELDQHKSGLLWFELSRQF